MKIFNELKTFSGFKRKLIGVAILGIFLIPPIALAQTTGWTLGNKPPGLPEDEIGGILFKVINGFLGLIGIVSVLYIVYGGARYLTSAGSEESIESAKTTLKYAVLGLGFAALAYAIVAKVLDIIK